MRDSDVDAVVVVVVAFVAHFQLFLEHLYFGSTRNTDADDDVDVDVNSAVNSGRDSAAHYSFHVVVVFVFCGIAHLFLLLLFFVLEQPSVSR